MSFMRRYGRARGRIPNADRNEYRGWRGLERRDELLVMGLSADPNAIPRGDDGLIHPIPIPRTFCTDPATWRPPMPTIEQLEQELYGGRR